MGCGQWRLRFEPELEQEGLIRNPKKVSVRVLSLPWVSSAWAVPAMRHCTVWLIICNASIKYEGLRMWVWRTSGLERLIMITSTCHVISSRLLTFHNVVVVVFIVVPSVALRESAHVSAA